MQHTSDREARQAQKAVLRERYPDYDARHHDVFVSRYNRDQDNAAMQSYLAARGLTSDSRA